MLLSVRNSESKRSRLHAPFAFTELLKTVYGFSSRLTVSITTVLDNNKQLSFFHLSVILSETFKVFRHVLDVVQFLKYFKVFVLVIYLSIRNCRVFIVLMRLK